MPNGFDGLGIQPFLSGSPGGGGPFQLGQPTLESLVPVGESTPEFFD